MSTINWPAGHEPHGADIHETNTGSSAAAPELVWAWLVRPDLWHSYYANVQDVRHIDGPWPEIGLGSTFSWITFRVPVTTRVTECVPHERLAWTGSGRGSRGHHAWLLSPGQDGTTLIRTEETQRGVMSRVSSPYLRRAMQREHQRWVDQLAIIAASGGRPPAA